MGWTYNRVLMSDIIAEVCHVFRVSEGEIKGSARHRPIVLPRFACVYLAKQLTALSFPQIGRALSRDHSSAVNARNKADIYRARNPEYQAYIDAVRIRLLSSRKRAEERQRNAIKAAREYDRLRLIERRRREREQEEATRAAEAIANDDMAHLSASVAAYRLAGGDFVEARS